MEVRRVEFSSFSHTKKHDAFVIPISQITEKAAKNFQRFPVFIHV